MERSNWRAHAPWVCRANREPPRPGPPHPHGPLAKEDALHTIAILAAGGVTAGTSNTIAGDGSILTVPLLVLLGMPGTVANGTNRVGTLVQNLAAMRPFQREGLGVVRETLPILVPQCEGSVLSTLAVSALTDTPFERLFGTALLLVLALTVWTPRPSSGSGRPCPGRSNGAVPRDRRLRRRVPGRRRDRVAARARPDQA